MISGFDGFGCLEVQPPAGARPPYDNECRTVLAEVEVDRGCGRLPPFCARPAPGGSASASTGRSRRCQRLPHRRPRTAVPMKSDVLRGAALRKRARPIASTPGRRRRSRAADLPPRPSSLRHLQADPRSLSRASPVVVGAVADCRRVSCARLHELADETGRPVELPQRAVEVSTRRPTGPPRFPSPRESGSTAAGRELAQGLAIHAHERVRGACGARSSSLLTFFPIPRHRRRRGRGGNCSPSPSAASPFSARLLIPASTPRG